MEWVSVCLLLVFVPSEAEKVGKLESFLLLEPSCSRASASRTLVGFCVSEMRSSIRRDWNLHQFGDLNQLGHLRYGTESLTAAVYEKFWRTSGEPLQVLSSRTRRAVGPCPSQHTDSRTGTGSMLTSKVWSRLSGASEGLEPS